MQIIQDTVAGLAIGAPVVHQQMAMFPLLKRKPDAGSRTYVTLDEALVSATARVSEVSDGGSVPELLFKNLGDRPVLLVEGEELVGAKQNRTLNVSILAPPRQETRIPVSCVERGRWGYDDGVAFQRSDRAHYARGRRTFPRLQLLVRQRLEEGVGDSNSPLHGAELPLAPGLVAHEPGNRLAAAYDDDLFPRLDARQQPGQLGLRFAHVDDGHRGVPFLPDNLARNTVNSQTEAVRAPGRRGVFFRRPD